MKAYGGCKYSCIHLYYWLQMELIGRVHTLATLKEKCSCLSREELGMQAMVCMLCLSCV